MLPLPKSAMNHRAQRSILAERNAPRLSPAPTPYLDDVAKAATRLEHEESIIRYQILTYADRNNFHPSGIKAMAQNGDFDALGERILEDLRSLDVIYRDRPREQIKMRRVIKLVEKEWFFGLWYEEETGRQRRLKFALVIMRLILERNPAIVPL